MKQPRMIQFAAASALFLAALSPSALLRADAFNDRTVVTFSNAVEVPGATLPPGTYVFKVLQSEADRVVIKISDKKEAHTFATVIANRNNYGTKEAHRDDPSAPTTGKTQFRFFEAPSGQPERIKTWFYPGQSFGFDFIYDKK